MKKYLTILLLFLSITFSFAQIIFAQGGASTLGAIENELKNSDKFYELINNYNKLGKAVGETKLVTKLDNLPFAKKFVTMVYFYFEIE